MAAMSKQTYTSAERAAREGFTAYGDRFTGTMRTISGRYAYTFTDTAEIIELKERARQELQTLPDAVLAALVTGKVDVLELLKKEIAQRGLDNNGKWIGFPAAAKLHGVQ
jgi:hypothetical protein